MDSKVINIKGYDVIIDEDDYNKVSNFEWMVGKYRPFFRKVWENNKTIELKLEYYILGISKDKVYKVTHKNNNKLDFRKVNFRVWLTNLEYVDDYYCNKEKYKDLWKEYRTKKIVNRKSSKNIIKGLVWEMKKEITSIKNNIKELKREARLQARQEKIQKKVIKREKYDVIINGNVCQINHKRGKILFDTDKYDKVTGYVWSVTKSGYAFNVKNRIIMHRLIMGDSPRKGMVVDHINGNRSDNRVSNLRWCESRYNSKNRGTVKGYKTKGITERYGKYYVRVHCDGVQYYLGNYTSRELAMFVYDINAKKLYGEYARCNLIGKISEEKYNELMSKYLQVVENKKVIEMRQLKNIDEVDVESLLKDFDNGMGLYRLTIKYNIGNKMLVGIIKDSGRNLDRIEKTIALYK